MRVLELVAASTLSACGAAPPTASPPLAHTAAVVVPEGQEEPEPGSTPVEPPGASRTASDDFDACVRELRDGRDLQGVGDEQRRYAEGLSRERAGDAMTARKAYFDVVANYPRSPLIPFAYLAFAEMFALDAASDPSKWPLAEQAYKEVLKYPPPQNTAYAYSWLRLGEATRKDDSAQTLNDFKKALEATKQHPSLACAVQVRARAKKLLVEVYAEAGQHQTAHAFFKPLADSDDDALSMLADLAERHRQNGRSKEACETARSKPSSAAGSAAGRLDAVARAVCKP